MTEPQLSSEQYRCPACKFTTGRVVFLAEGECPACGERYYGETVDELVIERARADERKKVIEEVEEWIENNEYSRPDHIEGFAGIVDTDDLLAKLDQLKGGE